MKRKDFLARTGALVLAPGSLVETASATAPPRGWEAVRAQFALDRTKRNLSTFVLASPPAPVREAILRHKRGLDPNPIGYLHANEGELDARVRAAAAAYLGAKPDEIALTDSTTMGLGLVYTGFELRSGDELLTSEHDFYATHESLRFAAERSGASVRKARLYGNPARASEDEIVSALRGALTPRTRLVALTWVHSSTGVKLPVRAIADAIADANRGRARAQRVVFALDGIHGLGVEAARPAELGCDFLIAGTHKWLFGPRGTGIVWGQPSAWSRVRSTIPTFAGAAYGAWLFGTPTFVPPGPRLTPGGYKAFEHRWAVAEAFRFHLGIGRAEIQQRTHSLARRLKDGLADTPRVELVTPSTEKLSSGIVCFTLTRHGAGEVVDALARRGIVASVTPYRQQYVRLGPSIANSEADVDAALAAIRQLA